jgi:hypothetical protein
MMRLAKRHLPQLLESEETDNAQPEKKEKPPEGDTPPGAQGLLSGE